MQRSSEVYRLGEPFKPRQKGKETFIRGQISPSCLNGSMIKQFLFPAPRVASVNVVQSSFDNVINFT